MKLFRFDDIRGFDASSEKDLLIREADEAFHANDRAGCVETINRLYNLLDETLAGPRRSSMC